MQNGVFVVAAFKCQSILFYEISRSSAVNFILGRLVKYLINAEGPINGRRRSFISLHILQASHVYYLNGDNCNVIN